MKIVLIDGQGGKLGQSIAEAIVKNNICCELFAIGTNSIATSAMLKGGAMYGATGENPVVVACRDADVIIGPVGIISADSMLGEITPAMAVAIGAKQGDEAASPGQPLQQPGDRRKETHPERDRGRNRGRTEENNRVMAK